MRTQDHIRLCLLALVLAGCALHPDGARAVESARLHVALVPDRAGARTTIELALHIGGPGGALPPALTQMDLLLPAGLGLATTQLGEANCDAAALIADGLEGCSANARLGFGRALAAVAPGEVEQATLNVLMGPPVENRMEVLFYLEGISPVFAQLVFPGLVQDANLPFGERLDTTLPLVPVWPEGPDLALVRLESTIGPLRLVYHRQANGRTIAYVPRGFRMPQRCPRGGFPFAAQLSFADGKRLTAFDRVRCPGARRA